MSRVAVIFVLLFEAFVSEAAKMPDLEQLDFWVSEGQVTDSIRVKFQPTADNALKSFVQRTTARTGCHNPRRLFDCAPEPLEAEHREAGLHLWYAFDCSDVASTFSNTNSSRGMQRAFAKLATSNRGSLDNEFGIDVVEPQFRVKSTVYGPTDEVPHHSLLRRGQKRHPMTGSNDPLTTEQGNYETIKLPAAWDIMSQNNAWSRAENVIVQVIDSGWDMRHEDSGSNKWQNPGEICEDGIDNDGNGYIDDCHGYNHADETGTDLLGKSAHGSHVTGIIAANTDNGIGVAGIAGGLGGFPGAAIMTSVVFGETGSPSEGFAKALVYGADNGAHISSNSWVLQCDNCFSQLYAEAIDYATDRDVIVVFSAGNKDSQTNSSFPGNYDKVIGVAATDDDKIAWEGTNYGDWVDIAAPGVEVYSTGLANNYVNYGGTSQASPHISGILALGKALDPDASPNKLKNCIFSTAENIDALQPDTRKVGKLGAGMVNAAAFLKCVHAQPSGGTCDIDVADLTCKNAKGVPCDDIKPPKDVRCAMPNMKMDTLRFRYVPSACGIKANQQGNKYLCRDNMPISQTSSVKIECYDAEQVTSAMKVRPSLVDPGTVFALSKKRVGELPANVTCKVKTIKDNLAIQTVTFETSGRVELDLKDRLGSLQVEGCDSRSCLDTWTYTTTARNAGTGNVFVQHFQLNFTGEAPIDLLSAKDRVRLLPGEALPDTSIERPVDICRSNDYSATATAKALREGDMPGSATCDDSTTRSLAFTAPCNLEVDLECTATGDDGYKGDDCKSITLEENLQCRCSPCAQELRFRYTAAPCPSSDSAGFSCRNVTNMNPMDGARILVRRGFTDVYDGEVKTGEDVVIKSGDCVPDDLVFFVLNPDTSIVTQKFSLDTRCSWSNGIRLLNSYGAFQFSGYSCGDDDIDKHNCYVAVRQGACAKNDGTETRTLSRFELNLNGDKNSFNLIKTAGSAEKILFPGSDFCNETVTTEVERCRQTRYVASTAAYVLDRCREYNVYTHDIVQGTRFPTPAPTLQIQPEPSAPTPVAPTSIAPRPVPGVPRPTLTAPTYPFPAPNVPSYPVTVPSTSSNCKQAQKSVFCPP